MPLLFSNRPSMSLSFCKTRQIYPTRVPNINSSSFFRHYSTVSVHTDLIQAVAHKKRAAHDDWPPMELRIIPAKRIARKRIAEGCLCSYLSCFRHSDTFFSIRCKISSDVEDSPPLTNFSPVICSYSSIYRSVMPATISGVMSGIC